MNRENIMNILLCLDDTTWDYSRHTAVTILSVLETNKNNKLKFFILSSNIPQNNINELKRIVSLYDQEIEFIINDNIIPEELKNVMINKNKLTWGVWYRRFFTKFIKNIDRILCIDSDVLVLEDISDIYNMDMKWKSIAWYYDCYPFRCKNRIFWIKNYINAGVLLFDAKKYDMNKINTKVLETINEKYSQYFHWSDQDKINIIFKDDIIVGKEEMNYLITNKWFTKWLNNAKIVHCLQKPYIKNNNIPQKIVNIYNKYLNLTKWEWFPEKEINVWFFKYIFTYIREFFVQLLINIWLWELIGNLFIIKRKYLNKKIS